MNTKKIIKFSLPKSPVKRWIEKPEIDGITGYCVVFWREEKDILPRIYRPEYTLKGVHPLVNANDVLILDVYMNEPGRKNDWAFSFYSSSLFLVPRELIETIDLEGLKLLLELKQYKELEV